MPRRVQDIMNIFAYVLGFVVVGVFLWQAVALFTESLKLGTTSLYATYTPLAIPQGFIIAGLFMLELTLIRLAIKASLDFMAERGTKKCEIPGTGIYGEANTK